MIRRGINRCTIFFDETDREVFLGMLRDAASDHGVAIHGFVLMDTHYHALATPRDAAALPSSMKQIGERYVRYFNDKYDRVGTLWTNRYRAIAIDSERRWLTCLRYIEQNPVRARMVHTPSAYSWSSYAVHALGEESDWLADHDVYRSLGATPEDRQAAYRAICDVELTEEEVALQRHPRHRRSSSPALICDR